MHVSGPLSDGSSPWRARPTIAAARREHHAVSTAPDDLLVQENARLRLPEDDTVQLAGLVLVEAFTPTTISKLYAAIDTLPVKPRAYTDQLKRLIDRWRSDFRSGAWQLVGTFARPDNRNPNRPLADPRLPLGVDSVVLTVCQASASVTLLIATFAIDERCGDLSDILRSDYPREVHDAVVRIPGLLGSIRRHLPISRPATAYYSAHIVGPNELKQEACAKRIDYVEARCAAWLSELGRGKFASLDGPDRCAMRIILSDRIRPFDESNGPLSPVGFDRAISRWNTTDKSEWFYIPSPEWSESSCKAVIAATKFTMDPAIRAVQPDLSVEGLVHRFARNQTDLIRLWSLDKLLDYYTREVTSIRDRFTRTRKPIASARALIAFLAQDGDDIPIVARDIVSVAKLPALAFQLPPYVDHGVIELGAAEDRDFKSLAESTTGDLNAKANQLATSADTLVRTVRGSVELLQVVSNAKLQRVALFFSMVAITISLLSVILR